MYIFFESVFKEVKKTQLTFYLFKFNNRSTRKTCEICSELIVKTPERRHWHRSGVFIANFEHFFTPFSCVCIVDFAETNVSW